MTCLAKTSFCSNDGCFNARCGITATNNDFCEFHQRVNDSKQIEKEADNRVRVAGETKLGEIPLLRGAHVNQTSKHLEDAEALIAALKQIQRTNKMRLDFLRKEKSTLEFQLSDTEATLAQERLRLEQQQKLNIEKKRQLQNKIQELESQQLALKLQLNGNRENMEQSLEDHAVCDESLAAMENTLRQNTSIAIEEYQKFLQSLTPTSA